MSLKIKDISHIVEMKNSFIKTYGKNHYEVFLQECKKGFFLLKDDFDETNKWELVDWVEYCLKNFTETMTKIFRSKHRPTGIPITKDEVIGVVKRMVYESDLINKEYNEFLNDIAREERFEDDKESV